MTGRLPPLLQEVADIMGEAAALKLAAVKGGQRIAVPGKVREGHWLVDLFGIEGAKQFCQHFTNGSRVHLEVPFGGGSVSRRSTEIQRLLDRGLSVNEIARQMNCTSRSIFNHKALRKKERPPDLFDLKN